MHRFSWALVLFACTVLSSVAASAEPWVDPQPENAGCPTCTGTQRQLFLMFANPVPDLHDPTVLVVDAAGDETYYALEIPEEALKPGAVIKVENFPVNFSTVEKAFIEFLVNDDTGDVYSISDPLLLEN